MQLLTFCSIVLNGIGSAILIFSPLVSPCGVPPKPAHPLLWQIGWGLLFFGFFLQAMAAYPH
jgi:hypothetical protein